MASQRRSKVTKMLVLLVVTLLAIFCFLKAYNDLLMRRGRAQYAVDFASNSGLLKKQVGTPIQMGYFVSGRMIGGCCDYATADLKIPISGPMGSGTLIAWLQDSFAGVRICSLVFRPEDGPDVVIAPDEKAHCERE